MIKILRSCLLGLLALPLAAQTPGFSVDGGLILGLDSLRKATHNSLGFTVGADYSSPVLENGISSRVGLAVALMPGSEKYGLKTSLTLIQAHGDLLIETGAPALHGIAGVSVNSYSMHGVPGPPRRGSSLPCARCEGPQARPASGPELHLHEELQRRAALPADGTRREGSAGPPRPPGRHQPRLVRARCPVPFLSDI